MIPQHLPAPLNRLLHGIEQALEQRATRRALSQLDDRSLKDLGISRAQARFEAERPTLGAWLPGRDPGAH